jgi:hypothetical protein
MTKKDRRKRKKNPIIIFLGKLNLSILVEVEETLRHKEYWERAKYYYHKRVWDKLDGER